MKTTIVMTFTAAVLSLSASAQVTDFSITQVDNAAAVAGINDEAFFSAGTVTNDVAIDFAGRYSVSQHELILTSGSIIDITPSSTPSTATGFGGHPLSVWDTFLAQGGTSAETTQGKIGIGGGPVRLEPSKEARVLSSTRWEVATNTAGSGGIINYSNFLVARFNLSPDAQGTCRYLGSARPVEASIGDAGEVPGFFTSGTLPIVHGVITVPEPTTAALLGVGGLVVRRRRRGGG